MLMVRDPRVLRIAKGVGGIIAVWALMVWMSRQGYISLWHDMAPSSTPKDDQLQTTELIIPGIQGKPSSSPHSTGTWSKIAKVSMFSYNNSTKDTTTFEEALRSHKAHDDRHGYLHYVLRRSLIGIEYSKPAYFLSIILQELLKPPAERLEWLMYIMPVC
jgi:hypothetical protein